MKMKYGTRVRIINDDFFEGVHGHLIDVDRSMVQITGARRLLVRSVVTGDQIWCMEKDLKLAPEEVK